PEVSQPRIRAGRNRSGAGDGRLLDGAVVDGEVLDDNRAGACAALDLAAGDVCFDLVVRHRPSRADYPLGGAPRFIEPICTFSAPATPCTTPPLMLNWILATA